MKKKSLPFLLGLVTVIVAGVLSFPATVFAQLMGNATVASRVLEVVDTQALHSTQYWRMANEAILTPAGRAGVELPFNSMNDPIANGLIPEAARARVVTMARIMCMNAGSQTGLYLHCVRANGTQMDVSISSCNRPDADVAALSVEEAGRYALGLFPNTCSASRCEVRTHENVVVRVPVEVPETPIQGMHRLLGERPSPDADRQTREAWVGQLIALSGRAGPEGAQALQTAFATLMSGATPPPSGGPPAPIPPSSQATPVAPMPVVPPPSAAHVGSSGSTRSRWGFPLLCGLFAALVFAAMRRRDAVQSDPPYVSSEESPATALSYEAPAPDCDLEFHLEQSPAALFTEEQVRERVNRALLAAFMPAPETLSEDDARDASAVSAAREAIRSLQNAVRGETNKWMALALRLFKIFNDLQTTKQELWATRRELTQLKADRAYLDWYTAADAAPVTIDVSSDDVEYDERPGRQRGGQKGRSKRSETVQLRRLERELGEQRARVAALESIVSADAATIEQLREENGMLYVEGSHALDRKDAEIAEWEAENASLRAAKVLLEQALDRAAGRAPVSHSAVTVRVAAATGRRKPATPSSSVVLAADVLGDDSYAPSHRLVFQGGPLSPTRAREATRPVPFAAAHAVIADEAVRQVEEASNRNDGVSQRPGEVTGMRRVPGFGHTPDAMGASPEKTG